MMNSRLGKHLAVGALGGAVSLWSPHAADITPTEARAIAKEACI